MCQQVWTEWVILAYNRDTLAIRTSETLQRLTRSEQTHSRRTAARNLRAAVSYLRSFATASSWRADWGRPGVAARRVVCGAVMASRSVTDLLEGTVPGACGRHVGIEAVLEAEVGD